MRAYGFSPLLRAGPHRPRHRVPLGVRVRRRITVPPMQAPADGRTQSVKRHRGHTPLHVVQWRVCERDMRAKAASMAIYRTDAATSTSGDRHVARGGVFNAQPQRTRARFTLKYSSFGATQCVSAGTMRLPYPSAAAEAAS